MRPAKTQLVLSRGGSYVDAVGNIVACGGQSDIIQVVTSAGKKHTSLLVPADGIDQLEGITYRISDVTFVIGCIEQNELCTFKRG